jgi:HK97 family phage major capsid protein
MKTPQQLREDRAVVVAAVRALVEGNPGDKWTADYDAKYHAMLADIDKFDAEITRTQKALDLEAGMQASIDKRADREGTTLARATDATERELQVFGRWLRGGISALDGDDLRYAQSRMGSIQAAQSVGTPAAGGYTVPAAFMDQLEVALKAFGGMRAAATIIPTETGADLPWPTVNDTAQVGAILAENSQITAQDVTFGVVTVKAYMYTSKLVLVSLQLLQDGAFDMSSFLAQALADRLGRAENAHFTTGTGTAQPNGIVTASASGKVGLTGQTLIVIFDDLVDLIHSVDPAYRAQSAKFMMNDASLKIVRKLKDSQNRPIFLPGYDGLAGPMADTLLGYPVIINQDMAVMAANAKSILFGNLKKYVIRQVLGVQLLQLRERYADFLQVGFFGFQRVDGNLIDAGTNPVKYYQNSAT